MKIKVLMTALLGFITISAFAQKGELSDAQADYEKFAGLENANYALAKPLLTSAKGHIDKASTNQKTSGLAQTQALKAAIYASLAYHATEPSSTSPEFTTAVEAISKAKELDTKNENTNMIKHASGTLAQMQLDRGVKAYQNKNYDEAYKSFDAARQIVPEDTTAILYTAVSALNGKNYAAAISNYNKLLTTDYKDKAKVYADLPTIYLYNKDTTGAVKIASEAVAKYPNNPDLRKEEIEVSLQAGQQSDLIAKIDAAIKADPNNKSLYYYAGLTYSQIAESSTKDIAKLKKAASKTPAKAGAKAPAVDPQLVKLQNAKFDNFNKAADNYKKAIAIDPNYYEAVLNLGYVTMAPGIDMYNDAQQLPVTQAKEYDAAMVKANAQVDQAKPYIFKAVELKPQSVDALTNQKSYYLVKKDATNANEVQKKIDALPKNAQ